MTFRSPEGANDEKGSRIKKIFGATAITLSKPLSGPWIHPAAFASIEKFSGGPLTFREVPSNLVRHVPEQEGRGPLANDTRGPSSSALPQSM